MWQFTTRGSIWRIATDGAHHIIGEERDVQNKRASYFCLECGKGKVRWSDRGFGEDWWTGIETCVGGVLYLHGFATPELPGHRGITAVEVRTGDVLWADEGIVFLAASRDRLHAVRGGITGNQVSELDPRSGEVRNTSRADDRLLYTIRNPGHGFFEEALVPGPLPEAEAGNGRIAGFAEERAGAEMIGYIDHPVTPVITTFVRRTAKPGDMPSRDCVLEVIDRGSGAVLFAETLISDARWPVEETVFVIQNVLYYVKGHKTLSAVTLGTTDT
ncbi:MAG: DUF4905 domain-containing protein [Bacteroidota bacterium]